MNRSEVVRRMVLDAICDDYENVDQRILPVGAQDAAKRGFRIQRPEIVDALAGLVENGLAKAYLLSSNEPARELQGMPPLDQPEEIFQTYFHITKKGMDFHSSEETCRPFEDEGKARI